MRLYFEIGLSNRDKALTEKIKNFFGVGLINKDRSKAIKFSIKSLTDLAVIINHFDKYPLITKKRADYELWKQVYQLMQLREHLTIEGIHKIVVIKASINRGLSEELKLAFPNQVPAANSRPISDLLSKFTIDPHWLAGFSSGESCFMITIKASNTCSLGFQVYLTFQLTQHAINEQLIKNFILYFECGQLKFNKTRPNIVDYQVTKLKDITEKIIPFFKKYKIVGVKALDFADWCNAAELMKNKKHLTKEGLEQIKKIKAGMNTGRK